MRYPLAILVLGLLVGCKDDEIVWVQFNEDGQELKVEVTAADSPAVPCVAEPLPEDTAAPSCEFPEAEPPTCGLVLKSNLGLTPVGFASIDPASGPIGTEHTVAVTLCDEFESLVGRATVLVDTEAVSDLDGDGEPDSRGEGEFDLRRDSADVGTYALTLQSLGSEGETRTDTFTIRLFQPEELSGESAE